GLALPEYQGCSILLVQSNKFEAGSPMGAHREQNPPSWIRFSTDKGRFREPESILPTARKANRFGI
ncbi:MAG: hypothetical protein U9O54_00750, partial [Chloroflexota bacterium]|nr:hypothetical protein [Chloroflexota bacterium]